MEMSTLSPSTERRPLRMHSLSPVPSTITSYSSSMVERNIADAERAGERKCKKRRTEKWKRNNEESGFHIGREREKGVSGVVPTFRVIRFYR